MRLAIEMFSIIIAITISSILFSSIISSDNQNSEARDFYNVVVNRIEDSNCNSAVVEECINEAKQNGYSLKVEDATIYKDNPSKYVVLTYTVRFPIFSLFGDDYEKQAVIEGYAR